MQSTHSFSHKIYGVTLKTIDNTITFNIYDGYKCIHSERVQSGTEGALTGVLKEVDTMTKHKITCAIAYNKYNVNLPNITFDLYDGTILSIQCE